MDFSYFLDSRFRGNDNKGTPSTVFARWPRPLDDRRRGELLHSAKMLHVLMYLFILQGVR